MENQTQSQGQEPAELEKWKPSRNKTRPGKTTAENELAASLASLTLNGGSHRRVIVKTGSAGFKSCYQGRRGETRVS